MRTPDPTPSSLIRLELAGRLADPFLSEALFDHLTDIVYFVKDRRGRYVVVNETLVQRSGAKQKSDLIGKTSEEIFRDPIGNRFLAQDLSVVETEQPLVDELERHAYPSGNTGWCLTTKLALKGIDGTVVGLVGISRDLQSPGEDASDLSRLARIVEQIRGNLGTPLRTSELADRENMSAYQLDRRCRQVYGIPPSQLILQLRMSAAATKLRQTEDSIVAIALTVGYSDQSAFTRQFRRTFGVSPGKFRVQQAN
ncbi:Multiple antibiotic resistance protein MarA [Stieleria neptunia]|uniref:Multiple antibiotic resistance protein MarA n=1 Tax=Stieleria neptunia TaxID=2527979 RepID=A0A518HNM0_9BACT|nr:AraC family transcriptional regulator [Stieleria neptunia]QDV42438.1 Multiple antibiotic resistance protein MarA [Stieleria neptunia]